MVGPAEKALKALTDLLWHYLVTIRQQLKVEQNYLIMFRQQHYYLILL